MEVLVRFYAGARAAAGTDEERLEVPDSATVAELAGALAERHGPALARVLAASTFLVDAVPGGRERRLEAGRQVEVLPPFAGG